MTPLIALMLVIGLVLLWRKKEKMGKRFLIAGTAALIFFGTFPVTGPLFGHWEDKYPRLDPRTLDPSEIKFVVVLGGGMKNDKELSSISVDRLLEGLRLQRRFNCKIIVSGGGLVPEAVLMKKIATEIGVRENTIIVDDKSTNTYDHTVYLKDVLGTHKFLLVTSAFHMPRAMGLFQKAGFNPIPAPTDYMARRNWSLVPRAVNLAVFDIMVKEVLSTIWQKLKGNI